MTPAPLTLSALLAFASATGFVLCARLAVRGTSEAGGARLSLAAFWLGAAAVAAIQGARSLSALLGADSFALIRALDQAATPAYCMAAGGMVYYVAYILTGRSTLAIPIGLYYVVMVPVLRYPVELARPVGYAVGEWNVNLVYEGSLASPQYTLALALAAVPMWASVLAYASLLAHTPEPAARYRIACMSVGLLLWVGAEVVVWATGLAATPAG
ncbi:MAG TPA: hypothetical protein VNX21_08230, partial [Candidatus Thermoplasmatota archaeon]|nr:hypothetical protein [Candidatus Thermoplasmatota archaeon]